MMDNSKYEKFNRGDKFEKLPLQQKMILGDMINLKKIAHLCNYLNINLTDEILKSDNPGYSVLKIWESRDGSTFRVLEEVFSKCNDNNLKNELHNYKLGIIQLSVILNKGVEKYDVSKEINKLQPMEKKPIKDLVELMLLTTFIKDIERKNVFVTIDKKNGWEKCCIDFVGQEIIITLHFHEPNRPVTTTGSYPAPPVDREEIRRNLKTCIDVHKICFVDSVDEIYRFPTLSSPALTGSSSSSSSRRRSNVYEEFGDIDVYSYHDYTTVKQAETELKMPRTTLYLGENISKTFPKSKMSDNSNDKELIKGDKLENEIILKSKESRNDTDLSESAKTPWKIYQEHLQNDKIVEKTIGKKSDGHKNFIKSFFKR